MTKPAPDLLQVAKECVEDRRATYPEEPPRWKDCGCAGPLTEKLADAILAAQPQPAAPDRDAIVEELAKVADIFTDNFKPKPGEVEVWHIAMEHTMFPKKSRFV